MKIKYVSWLLLAGWGFVSGCTTTAMKGTPFYSGEYKMRKGTSENRVNVWPLVYYRDPALSVLWPLMEFTPEHIAFRPLYSMYERDTENPVYNVLWPIARFDPGREKYRVFPVYWGDHFFNIFPLYWHKGSPISGTGHDSLFPLWIWKKKANGYSLDLLWPFLKSDQTPHKNAWRVWPLYGRDKREDSLSTFALWPFFKTDQTPHKNAWRLWPLYGRDKQEDSLSTFALWPLIQTKTNDVEQSHFFIPFYGYTHGKDRSEFYSLPWMNVKKPNGTGWATAFPFYYSEYSKQGKVLVTPLYARKQDGDGNTEWNCFIPFVFFDKTKDTHFMTILGGRWTLGDDAGWMALPLLSWGHSKKTSGSNTWLLGLAENKWSTTARSNYIFPFYFWKKEDYFYTLLWGRDRVATYYATPLIGRYHGNTSGSWVFPLYRHQRFSDGVSGNYLLLGGYSKQKNSKEHHFYPFYTYDYYEHKTSSDNVVISKSKDEKNIKPTLLKRSTLRYLLLGKKENSQTFDLSTPAEKLIAKNKTTGFFPFWKSRKKFDLIQKTQKEKSSWLLFFYDSLHEKKEGDNPSEYTRKRILWRVFHYEKLDGNSTTDIFPAITIDSRKDGYYKCSFFWHLFRYENNPKTKRKKLDILFIPLRR